MAIPFMNFGHRTARPLKIFFAVLLFCAHFTLIRREKWNILSEVMENFGKITKYGSQNIESVHSFIPL